MTYHAPVARRESVHWGNTVAALRYNHVFNEKMFGNFRLSYSDLQTASTFERSDSFKTINNGDYEGKLVSGNYQSNIRQIGLAFDGQYSMGNTSFLRFGAEVNSHRFTPSLLTDTIRLDHYGSEAEPAEYNPLQLAAYASLGGGGANCITDLVYGATCGWKGVATLPRLARGSCCPVRLPIESTGN